MSIQTGSKHLDYQAASPAQKHRALDPQRTGAWRRVLGWQNPPELRSQRRRYGFVNFVADRLELALQPGHALWRQRGAIDLLRSGLQQRPDTQQPAWIFDPAGTVTAGRFADDDSKPRRRGNLAARLPPCGGVWPVHVTRLPGGGGCQQRHSSPQTGT